MCLPRSSRLANEAAGAIGHGKLARAGAAVLMLLGMWCLVAFIKTSDPFVQIFSFALTLAYMIGISGRFQLRPDAGLHDRHLGA
jgi:hypothetical protein